MYLAITLLYLSIGIAYIATQTVLPKPYIGLLLFFTMKWLVNYRKCTISYLECKVRNVKKEDGYLYQFLNGIMDLRYTPHNPYIMIAGISILTYHYGFGPH